MASGSGNGLELASGRETCWGGGGRAVALETAQLRRNNRLEYVEEAGEGGVRESYWVHFITGISTRL